MSEQNKEPNVTEPIQKGMEAADKIKGAIKTSKAISGMTKGGAAAGPYGAAAVALWENKELVAKVAIVISFLSALPILFILLLPSIIFGGLNADKFDPNKPILNDETAIMSNMREAEEIVREKLTSNHQDVIADINRKIGNLPENHKGIIKDSNGGSIFFNTALVISQYCASKKEEPTSINMVDLKFNIWRGGNKLYSFSENVTKEETEVTTTKEDGTQITEKVKQTVHTYTVIYSGDDRFASEIFNLTDNQREMANEFAKNLMTFLYGSSSFPGVGVANVSGDVLAYEPLLKKYAELYGIPEYVELLKAIMMQESGGRGTDPMQSSESSYNLKYPKGPGTITDPEYSIDCGVHYFADALAMAGSTSPSDINKVSLALQGYNFGTGYITWAINKYGGYSQENASTFSEKMRIQMGWSRYGDPLYVPHVLRYYVAGNIGGSDGWGSPFVGKDWRSAVSSEYGDRVNPVTGIRQLHNGLDIAFPTSTPINAIKGGIVVTSSYDSLNGNLVSIDHGDGTRSSYLHCSERLVIVGQNITIGQPIAKVGNTGQSTGPHLHLIIRINGDPQNPRNFIP